MTTPLNEQLKRVRRISGLTQGQVADAVGWKVHSTVSNVERGTRGTQLEEAERWAEACGYVIVMVPKSPADPEGLVELVGSIEDPAARNVLAALARLTRRAHRFWYHFLDDFAAEEERASRFESAPEATPTPAPQGRRYGFGSRPK